MSTLGAVHSPSWGSEWVTVHWGPDRPHHTVARLGSWRIHVLRCRHEFHRSTEAAIVFEQRLAVTLQWSVLVSGDRPLRNKLETANASEMGTISCPNFLHASRMIPASCASGRNVHDNKLVHGPRTSTSAHFIVWLDRHKPQLVNEEFRAGSPSFPIPWDIVLRRLQNHGYAVDPITFPISISLRG